MTPVETVARGIRRETDVETTMSDGCRLRADVYRPTRVTRPMPVLLKRTVYGKRRADFVYNAIELARREFIVIVQDHRGRYASDGDFVPLWMDSTRDGLDGAETIAWARALPGASGRVGMYGTSYNAVTQFHALAQGGTPDALLAGGHCADSRSVWPGVFRVGRQLQWAIATISPDTRRRAGQATPHSAADGMTLWRAEGDKWMWWLPLGDLPERALGGLYPYWELWLAAHRHDFLQLAEVARRVPAIPISLYTGWYDRHVDTIDLFTAANTLDRSAPLRLTVGPWTHGTSRPRQVGEIDFGAAAEESFPDVALDWFDWTLRGVGPAGDQPPVRLFVMGVNRWQGFDAWPVPHGELALHVGPGGTLTWTPPGEPGGVPYLYDPRDPVPSLLTDEYHEGPIDQRPLDGRPDIVRFQTDPLEHDVRVIGQPIVHLFASTDGPDTDWHVKLVDVDQDGRAYNVTLGMIRARFRDGWDNPSTVTPNAVYEYRIQMKPTAIVFRRGHRIRIAITSSDFPNYDRNHNTGLDDLHTSSLRTALQHVHWGPRHPTRIVLPLADGT